MYLKIWWKNPMLPDEDISECPDCQTSKEVLVQMYIPGLPDQVKALFPSNLQDALIVVMICTECLTPHDGEIETKIYHQNDISKLVYKEPRTKVLI